jgi:probable phosphoglycerate mutase
VSSQPLSLITSPLGRARQTAEFFAAALNAKPQQQPLLKEYGYGEWEGLTSTQVQQQHPHEWAARQADKWNYVVPGGESYAMASERARQWLATLDAKQVMVAVSHQMMGRVIRGAYLGLGSEATMALQQNNGEIILLAQGQEQVVRI